MMLPQKPTVQFNRMLLSFRNVSGQLDGFIDKALSKHPNFFFSSFNAALNQMEIEQISKLKQTECVCVCVCVCVCDREEERQRQIIVLHIFTHGHWSHYSEKAKFSTFRNLSYFLNDTCERNSLDSQDQRWQVARPETLTYPFPSRAEWHFLGTF